MVFGLFLRRMPRARRKASPRPLRPLCVWLCVAKMRDGDETGTHSVHDLWPERVHPMQGNLPRNPKESERRMVKQPQSSPWAGDKVWPHPGSTETPCGAFSGVGSVVSRSHATQLFGEALAACIAQCRCDGGILGPGNGGGRREDSRPRVSAMTAAESASLCEGERGQREESRPAPVRRTETRTSRLV